MVPEDDELVLRRRTRKVDIMRDRSLSPEQLASTMKPASWGMIDAPMMKQQQAMKLKYPEVFFTDEFCERESGTTTCLVGGITCNYGDLQEFNKMPFELRFEDGRLCLTHTSGTMPEVVMKRAWRKISRRQLIIITIWVVTITCLVLFMSIFSEKYNELIKDYSS